MNTANQQFAKLFGTVMSAAFLLLIGLLNLVLLAGIVRVSRPISAVPGSLIRMPCLTVSGWWRR